MAGHKNSALNKALWQESRGKGGWRSSYEVAKRKRERTIEAGEVPDFLAEFLPGVQIESDEGKGRIPFHPYPYQVEMFKRLLAGQRVVWLKERQIGATWVLLMYAVWLAAYHPAAHVALISMGQRETNELMRKVRFILNHLPPDLYREWIGIQQLEFVHTGSTVTAFPSTESAGVSFHFRFIVQDEAARHPYGRENYYEYLPTLSPTDQIVVCSTSNPDMGPSGFFYDVVQETLRGENDYEFVFNGRYTRPEHDEQYYEQMRKRYRLAPQEFDSHYPVSVQDAFVGKTGLVYSQFSRDRHVVDVAPVAWEDCAYRVAGVDPGGGDPTAIVVMGAWQDAVTGVVRWHQYGEFYVRGGASVDDLVQYLGRWKDLTRVYLDTAGGDVVLRSLQSYGFQAYAAVKDRAYGLGVCAELLDSGWLTIASECENSIDEFGQYRWLERTDPTDRSRYKTATPVDNHADAMDARRYAIASFTRQLNRAVAGGYLTQRDRQLAGEQPRERVGLVWR